MRTLQEKYNAIQEGKFTKEQFLRDARMEQPNLVTRFNGYNDAVQILKNRGMISEAKLTEDFSEYSNDALADMIINLSRYEGNEEDIRKVKQELERRKGQVKEDQTPKHKVVAQWMGPDYYLAKKSESDWDDKDYELYDRLYNMVTTTGQVPDVRQFKHLKEATQLNTTKKGLADYRYKVTNDMDKYPYEQILRGLRVELETMGVAATPTAEEYQKALAKVLKNLEKDSIYYTNQVAGVKANRKRTDVMIDATPKNEVDKENGLQKAQLKEAFKKIIKNILSEDLQDPDLYDPDEEREERRSRYGQNELGDGEEVYEMYRDDEDDDELDDSRGLFKGFRDDEDDEIDYDDENFSDPFIDGDLEEATDTEADKNMVRKFMTMYETEPSKFERLHKQAQVQAATTKDIKFKHLLSLLDRAKAGALQSLSNQDKFEADREGMFESVSLKDLLD